VEEVPPWKRGRAGTALGRAVHAVLQSIDLETGADIESAARAQAAAEGIAGRDAEVARMVRSALAAPSVRAAAAGGRYWREVFVAGQIDGTTIEGFVDLLYESKDALVVVDYKTDALPATASVDEAARRYRLQGAAYALALQEALGRPVARCVFVFTQPREAVERDIDDLSSAMDDVRELIGGVRVST
jgi:ATP-dependent helicase/nuclease subunit A